MRTQRRSVTILGLAAAGLVVTAGVAQAQLTTSDVGVNPTYEQTAGGIYSTGGFFSARAFFTNANDFTGGSVTIPTSTSEPLTYGTSPYSLTYGDSSSSLAALQTLYPAGNYTFDLTGGTYGPTQYTIDYTENAYSNVPELTASSYNGLQGLNVADPYTIDFNTYVPGPVATSSTIFFTIDNASNQAVFSETLPSTDTSVTIPGGTLASGQTYTFDLLFDNRITSTQTIDGSPVTLTEFYDTHTDGSFTTATSAVPEPSTWAMLFMGFIGLGVLTRRAAPKAA